MEMKTYYGVIKTPAIPMTRKEYREYTNNTPDENPDEEGLLLEYKNYPSNHPNHAGRIYWETSKLTKEVYVSEIIPALPKTKLIDYQQRVVDEYAELIIKIDKLETFLNSKPENVEDLELLNLQLTAMKTYANILAHRINKF